MAQPSKSKFTLFCQCPRALWLKTYKPELEVVDASTKARFETGNQVGDLAMGLFGDYTEVTTKENCKRPYNCAFLEHCSSHLPKPSVFDLYICQRLNRKQPVRLCSNTVVSTRWLWSGCGRN